MQLTQAELLKLQNTTEETNTSREPSNTQLIHRERVEGTGFDIITIEENKSFVALGKYRLTTERTAEECREMINNKDWEIILGLIGAALSATESDITATQKELEKKLTTIKEGGKRTE